MLTLDQKRLQALQRLLNQFVLKDLGYAQHHAYRLDTQARVRALLAQNLPLSTLKIELPIAYARHWYLQGRFKKSRVHPAPVSPVTSSTSASPSSSSAISPTPPPLPPPTPLLSPSPADQARSAVLMEQFLYRHCSHFYSVAEIDTIVDLITTPTS